MDDFENTHDFQNLIHLMRSAPKPGPPQGLEEKIMAAVTARPVGYLVQFKHALLQPRRAASLDPRECSICFMLTGAFYLVLGAVLLAGLKFMGQGLVLNQWLRLLPWFGFLAAIWFFGLAAAMAIAGQKALAGIKAGTMLFMAAVLAGIPLFLDAIHSPARYLPAAMLLTAAAMGFLLYRQVAAFSKADTVKIENNRKITA
jgi:hypothetical protein